MARKKKAGRRRFWGLALYNGGMSRDDIPPHNLSADGARRLGDPFPLPGDYEHRALTQGPAMQRRWHETKLELLDWFFPPVPGERILDVGCGSGVFASRMAELGAQVTAVDSNPEVVNYGTRHFARDGLEFRRGLLDELGFADGSYDAATCLEVVEHVFAAQADKLFCDLRRIVRPGGRLLMTTPNYRGLWPMVEWASDRFGSNHVMREGRHINFYHRARLRESLERAGFEVERLRTFSTFAPFTAVVSYSLAKRLGRWERGWDFPFGNILAVAARNPGE